MNYNSTTRATQAAKITAHLIDKKSMPPLVPPIRLDATRRPWAAAVQRLRVSAGAG